ncbi:MAG: hypothetical protein ACRD04_05235 [Terriglobales bacterium]
MSERYVHPTPEAMERAMARMETADRKALLAVQTGTGILKPPAAMQ